MTLAKHFKPTLIMVAMIMALSGCGGAPADNANYVASSDSGITGSSGLSGGTTIQMGTGGGAQFVAGTLSANQLTTGTAGWKIGAVVVDKNNLAVTDVYDISFVSTCVSSGLSTLDNSVASTVAGRASVVYSPSGCTGIDTLVASVTIGNETIFASIDLDIDALAGSDNDVAIGDEGSAVFFGSGIGGNFADGELQVSATTIAAGANMEISAKLVDVNGDLVGGSYEVTFVSSCASDGLASIQVKNTPKLEKNIGYLTSGSVIAYYTAIGCVGDDEIIARLDVEGLNSETSVVVASATVNVLVDEVLGVKFVEADPSQLALVGMGGDETSEVSFVLVGGLGAPIIGEEVTFELTSAIGGVAIASGRDTAISDNSGRVSTVIQAGTVSTSVNVKATHNTTGNQSISDSIVISSGVTVDSKLSLSIEEYAPAGAINTDGVELSLGVIASDMFGNDAVDGTQIFFASPVSGNITSSCTLISGQCAVAWLSAGFRPADHRAPIIAYTSGAEDFRDINGDNVYDAADQLGADVGEPYVDENYNQVYDLGEFFVDANNSGARDGGNSLWDGPCLLAVNAGADCSGNDSVMVYKQYVIYMPATEAAVLLSEVSYDNGVTYSNLPVGGRIQTSLSANGSALLRLAVGEAGVDVMNPLPSGSRISATLESASSVGGGLAGGEAFFTAPTQTVPQVLMLRVTDNDLSSDSSTSLIVTVDYGALDPQFSAPSDKFYWDVALDSQ